ncbi:MAG: hypothetical protein ACTHJS_17480 [Xanthobacteraceae bacterium]
MLRSKILLARLALIPAALLVTGHSSLGEAKGDDCKAKPEGTAPAGLHWYYRVDRANSRHCWYLHEQGMRVHSLGHTTVRDADARNDTVPENDTAGEQVWKMPAVIGGRPAESEQAPMAAEQQSAAFATRWVDLPKSVDLNARDSVSASNGYAPERRVDNRQEELPPAWSNVSATTGDVRQDTGTPTSFGSISLAGAVILALLLVSEAFIRFARTLGSTLRLRLRTDSRRRAEPDEMEVEAPDVVWRMTTASETISRTQTGAGDLRRLLQRAGTGLRPPQSFAPSRSPQRREDTNRARVESALARLKSRSFSGMTWASL